MLNETFTSLASRYDGMPPGVALARSRVPSSRSAARNWMTRNMPKATNIPSTPGNIMVPSVTPPASMLRSRKK